MDCFEIFKMLVFSDELNFGPERRIASGFFSFTRVTEMVCIYGYYVVKHVRDCNIEKG